MSTITTETVEQAVYTALESFGADPGEFSSATTFEALDIDSLDLAELAQIIDEKFGVQLKGEDMKRIRTIGDAIEAIVAKA